MFGNKTPKVSGHIIIMTPGEQDVENETLQCVHCGKHWIRKPGSGNERGFCMKCHGVTCGQKKCDFCVPYEAQIEIMEGATEMTARRYLDEFLRVEHGKLEL